LFQPLLGHLGWVGVSAGLVALAAVSRSRTWTQAGVGYLGLSLTIACLIPARLNTIVPNKLDVSTLIFVTLGSVIGLLTVAAVVTLLCRRRELRPRNDDSWFLAGWLLIEFLAYFMLTPFPAARRVLLLTFVGALIAARLMSRSRRLTPSPKWLPTVSVVAGLSLFAVDTWDAYPEKRIAEQAREICTTGQVWFSGHWGFQYYCDRAGMQLVSPQRPNQPKYSTLRPGDYLVLPIIPDSIGFYRPYHGEANFAIDSDAVQVMNHLCWDDWWPAQTIPNLYGGRVPVVPRSHPRLQVTIYRVTRDWVPQSPAVFTVKSSDPD
jgi:hypothetical protein